MTVADAVVTLDVAMAAGEGDEIIVSGSRPITEFEAAAPQIQRTSSSLVSFITSDSTSLIRVSRGTNRRASPPQSAPSCRRRR